MAIAHLSTYLFTGVVGAVFLITGIAKALSSRQFTEHLFELALLPPEIMVYLAFAFVGIECGLGLALILHVFPQYVVPAAMLLIMSLSALTFWANQTGRTDSCGCYGGLALVTPQQSLMLNAVYVMLLGSALYLPIDNYETARWKVAASICLACINAGLAFRSEEKPIINLSALQPGRRWQRHWLSPRSGMEEFVLEDSTLQQGSYFVVFLGRDCPYCKQWISTLNILDAQTHRPPVIGVMALAPTEIAQFKQQFQVHFSIVSMSRLLFGFLAEGVPTAVLIKDGTIETVEMGKMPSAYEQEIQQFYRVVRSPKAKANAFFA